MIIGYPVSSKEYIKADNKIFQPAMIKTAREMEQVAYDEYMKPQETEAFYANNKR